ncbi:hypothetical protein Tco_1111446 [Tanacetum coccineum]|uniref:Uncharacterized protein n=1 Tax=Tanacetum coccineum TaxID=301880 RepID=A0ABQ5IP45_9ASTR
MFKNAKEKLATVCSEIVFLEYLIRKASLEYRGDTKFLELQEKYVQVSDGGNDVGNGDADDDGENGDDLGHVFGKEFDKPPSDSS